jgi:hypothetical protein
MANAAVSPRDPQTLAELRDYLLAIDRRLAASDSTVPDYVAAWRTGYRLALRFGAADEANELRPPDADGQPVLAAYFAAFALGGLAQVREKLARLVAFCNQQAVAKRQASPNAELEFSNEKSPRQWAKVFRCSWDTLKRRMAAGKIRYCKLSTKSYRIAIADLPAEEPSKQRADPK